MDGEHFAADTDLTMRYANHAVLGIRIIFMRIRIEFIFPNPYQVPDPNPGKTYKKNLSLDKVFNDFLN